MNSYIRIYRPLLLFFLLVTLGGSYPPKVTLKKVESYYGPPNLPKECRFRPPVRDIKTNNIELLHLKYHHFMLQECPEVFLKMDTAFRSYYKWFQWKREVDTIPDMLRFRVETKINLNTGVMDSSRVFYQPRRNSFMPCKNLERKLEKFITINPYYDFSVLPIEDNYYKYKYLYDTIYTYMHYLPFIIRPYNPEQVTEMIIENQRKYHGIDWITGERFKIDTASQKRAKEVLDYMEEKGYKITKEGVYTMLRRKKEYLETKQEVYTRIRDIFNLELYNYAKEEYIIFKKVYDSNCWEHGDCWDY